jgi:hypothetical protein
MDDAMTPLSPYRDSQAEHVRALGERLLAHAKRVEEWKEGMEYEREARAIANEPNDESIEDMG